MKKVARFFLDFVYWLYNNLDKKLLNAVLFSLMVVLIIYLSLFVDAPEDIINSMVFIGCVLAGPWLFLVLACAGALGLYDEDKLRRYIYEESDKKDS